MIDLHAVEAFSNMKCYSAGDAQIKSIVHIHQSSLPDDVFANLGVNMLTEFYASSIRDEKQHLLAVELENEVVGFCLLSNHPGSITGLLPGGIVLAGFRLLLNKPKLFFSGLRQFLKGWGFTNDSSADSSAEISFIAVESAHQGKRAGSLLIDNAVDICRHEGKRSVRTKTSNQRLAQHYKNRYGALEIDSYELSGSRYSLLEWPV